MLACTSSWRNALLSRQIGANALHWCNKCKTAGAKWDQMGKSALPSAGMLHAK
jgi:hypothetical protein